MVAKDDREESDLLRILKEKGMSIKVAKVEEWPENVREQKNILIGGTVKIDPIIYRGIAKIAFNYLAYSEGKRFVLSGNFDGIRNFIRYEKGNANDYFGVNEPPILFFDRFFLRKFGTKETSGHLVIVEWQGMNLISKVSIFNTTTYLIRCCKNFKGIWRPIRCGHHFDINSKRVSKLKAVSRCLMP